MKRVVVAAVLSSLLLTGCKSDEKVKEVFTGNGYESVFPEGMVGNGEQWYGNGKTDKEDLFTTLEEKIWGSSNGDDE